MQIDIINSYLPLVGYIGGMVALWVNLNNKINLIEYRVQQADLEIKKLEAGTIEAIKDLQKDIKQVLQDISTLQTEFRLKK